MFLKTWICGAFLLALVFTAESSFARSDTVVNTLPGNTFDSSYITGYTGLLTARLFLLFQNASLFVNPGSERISKISYRPNVNVRVGIAGFWKWFGLGLSIENPFYKTDQDTYGKTNTLDLRVNAFGRYVAGEFFFQQYHGFYINSPEGPGDKHYIIPDMQTLSLGIAGYWIYNAKRFSIRAAYIQNECQKKSAGSLVVRPSFLYYRISSAHGIIPAEFVDNYLIPYENLISGGDFYSVGLSPGYVYTLVFLKHCYLTAAAFPGVAAQFSSWRNDVKSSNGFEFSLQLNARIALGYNSGKWFLGGSAQTGFNEVPNQMSNALFGYDVAQVRVWGGMRFDFFRKKKRTPLEEARKMCE